MESELSLEQIYDAAFDDEALRELSVALGARLGARSTLIHWIHSDGATDVLAHSGYFTDEQLSLYAREFAVHDPWVAAVAQLDSSNQVHDLESLVPVAQFRASDFYNDYIREIGDDTGRCLGVRLQSSRGSGFIALQRGIRQAGFDAANVAMLQHYSGHLLRMLAMRGTLGAVQQESEELSAMFDTFAQPALLVDSSLRVRQLNQAAEAMLGAGHVLNFREGCISAKERGAVERLQGAVSAVISSREPTALSLCAENGSRCEVSVASVPLLHGRRLALLLVASDDLNGDYRSTRLRALYGLSASEAALALLLSQGMSPAQISEARQTSVGTVRFQIKQVASKMGCSRQSEIVGIVCRLPPLRKN